MSAELVQLISEIISFTKSATGLIQTDIKAVILKINEARKNLSGMDHSIGDQEVLDLIQRRKEARASKKWGEADKIRDRFIELGIVLKDNPDGTTTWKYK
jgi:cysteinyl-tRNA synthetase